LFEEYYGKYLAPGVAERREYLNQSQQWLSRFE